MGYAGPTHYPDELNPFGDEDDEQQINSGDNKKDDYPEYLSPFGDDDYANQNGKPVEDYDDSLNPFGDDELQPTPQESKSNNGRNQQKNIEQTGSGNPFDEDEDEENEIDGDTFADELKSQDFIDRQQQDKEDQASKSCTPQPDSLEPPKPLPRTKSLLKKEQAFRRKQEQEQQLQHSSLDHNHAISIQSTTSSTTSSSSLTTTTTNNSASTTMIGSFQRNKNKRNAPPVPVNFKREVPGSLDAIDEELNSIGSKLEIIERESDLCQETLKARESTDEADFTTTRNKYIELIKRKGSIMRRQRELMYEKRELKLDQLHSDIEYELRMIGNKQVSNRTPEDEAREKELLKKLVEIVEEKSDIVENLNKISSSDEQDIEQAFRRLNILDCLPQSDNKKTTSVSSKVATKQDENCDKKSLAKFSKIATLLPKGGTIKGTMKPLKHTKRLFKKARDSSKQQQPLRDQPPPVSLPTLPPTSQPQQQPPPAPPPPPPPRPGTPPPLPSQPPPAPATTSAPIEPPQQES